MAGATDTSDAVIVQLLADYPAAIAAVAEMRWREWGQPPEPTDLAWWTATTTREAGRDGLPVTWVALDAGGVALGAVGLIAYDWYDWPEWTPWVAGMIIRPDRRGQGLGGRLMARLEAWARDQSYARAWVATGGRAIAFYQEVRLGSDRGGSARFGRCGDDPVETALSVAGTCGG